WLLIPILAACSIGGHAAGTLPPPPAPNGVTAAPAAPLTIEPTSQPPIMMTKAAATGAPPPPPHPPSPTPNVHHPPPAGSPTGTHAARPAHGLCDHRGLWRAGERALPDPVGHAGRRQELLRRAAGGGDGADRRLRADRDAAGRQYSRRVCDAGRGLVADRPDR